MRNLGGFFPFGIWNNFRYQASQTIELELSKPDPSLINILREDDLIQELKNGQNSKLEKFLALHLNEMLEYVVTMPPEDTHERGHKLPFVVNQILSQDCGPILDSFFEPVFIPKKEEPIEAKQVTAEFHDDELVGTLPEEEFVQEFHEQQEQGPLIVKNQSDEVQEGSDETPMEVIQKQETEPEIKTDDNEVKYNLPVEPEHEEEEGEVEEVYDYEDEEEEKVAGMSAFESTTVETKEPSKYDNLKKLFDFLLPQRPSSTTSSLDTNDTNVNTETEEELNPVLCGYFTRLMTNLINRRPKLLFQFFTERPDVVHRMTKHLYSSAITESLIRVLLCETHGLQETELLDEYNDMRDQIVKEILLQLNPANSAWAYKNIASILIEMASRRNFQNLLTSPPMLQILFGSILVKEEGIEKEKVFFLRRECLRILSSLLTKHRENVQKEQSHEQKQEEKKEEEFPASVAVEEDAVLIGFEQDEDLKSQEPPKPIIASAQPSPLIETIYEHFDSLVALLDLESETSINSITGDTQQSFGSTRLYVVDIVVSLVILNEPGINCKISESGILKKLLYFYGTFEWNNLLHFKLGVIFSTILQNHLVNSELLHSLFTQANFIPYITALISSDDFVLKNGTARRIERGFYPYLVRFMDEIQRYRIKCPYIEDQVKAFGEEEWEEVWAIKIKPKKSKYAIQLGGYHPSQPKPVQPEPVEDTKTEEQDKTEQEDDRFSSFNKHRNLLKSIGASSDRHSNLFLNNEKDEEEEEEEEDEEEDIFQGWNVDDPESVLEEEKERQDRYASKRGEITDDISGLEEEFFDAKESEEETEDEEYNDYNYWKVDLSSSYDLDRLMQEM